MKSTARRDPKTSAASAPKTRKRAVVVEDATELSEAKEWQRAQAWATWEKIKAGDVREVSLAQLREDARRLQQVKKRTRTS